MPKQALDFKEVNLMSNINFPEIDIQDFDIQASDFQALNVYINLMPKNLMRKYQNPFKNFHITNFYQFIIKKLNFLKFNA